MTKQTAIRIPADLVDFANMVCRIEGTSMNSLITRALEAHFTELRRSAEFREKARDLLASEIRQLRSLGD